eukprot:RCo021059
MMSQPHCNPLQCPAFRVSSMTEAPSEILLGHRQLVPSSSDAQHVTLSSPSPISGVGGVALRSSFRVSSFASTSPTTLQARRSWGIPLWVSLTVPALLVAVAFMIVLWQTTSATASNTVDSLSGRVFDVVELQLEAQVSLLTRAMAATAQMGAAAVLVNSTVDSLHRYFHLTLGFIAGPSILGFASVAGEYISAKRLPNGEFQIGHCPEVANRSSPGDASLPLLQYWVVNSETQVSVLASSTPYNALARPWYTAVSDRNFTAAFSPAFLQAVQATVSLTLGVPVRSSDGSVLGVVSVFYDLSTIEDALQSTHDALGTSGVLLLLTEDGSLIASSSSRNSTNVVNLIGPLRSLLFSGSKEVLRTTLSPFGACFVYSLTISGQVRPDFYASGLNWKLFLVLPQSEYYGGLWSNNRLAVILVGVCSGTFFVVQLFFYRVIVAFHLRTLLAGLVHL